MWVKNVTDFGRFGYLNISCLKIKLILLNLYEFLKRRIYALVRKLEKKCVSVDIRQPFWCSWKGHQHGVSIQSFINLGKPFFPISRISNISQTLFFARVFVYLSFFVFQILVLLYWMVCIFIFHCVTVQAENSHCVVNIAWHATPVTIWRTKRSKIWIWIFILSPIYLWPTSSLTKKRVRS